MIYVGWFHSHRGTPIAGWFILWKILSICMNWGYPYFRKPRYGPPQYVWPPVDEIAKLVQITSISRGLMILITAIDRVYKPTYWGSTTL